MIDEVLVFIYGTAAAVILIAMVAYYYMPTLVGATQAQAEYAALRDAALTLILAQDGKSVHVCINSTAPKRVHIQRAGVWMDAQRDCRIDPDGHCVSGQGWLCRWYLGAYRPGDNITIILKTDHASVVKSYRIGAIVPSARSGASNMGGQNGINGQNNAGQNGAGQSGAQVATVTITGTVYSSTVATVTTTVTSYGVTTTTVTAPTTATVTYTVVVQDPSFTTTRTLTACKPDTTTTSSTSSTRWFPPVELGRYGFQLATTSTVTSYTTIYTTSYVTSTVTTTVWSTVTSTYTPTTTITVTNLRPGVEVICYVCSTSTPSKTCSTTTLVTTTSSTTITGGSGLAQPNTPDRGLSTDTFFLVLSAVVMMASSVMLVKKQ
jgi:hypothetical protein